MPEHRARQGRRGHRQEIQLWCAANPPEEVDLQNWSDRLANGEPSCAQQGQAWFERFRTATGYNIDQRNALSNALLKALTRCTESSQRLRMIDALMLRDENARSLTDLASRLPQSSAPRADIESKLMARTSSGRAGTQSRYEDFSTQGDDGRRAAQLHVAEARREAERPPARRSRGSSSRRGTSAAPSWWRHRGSARTAPDLPGVDWLPTLELMRTLAALVGVGAAI